MPDLKIRLGIAVVSETYVVSDALKNINRELKNICADYDIQLFSYPGDVINSRSVSKEAGQFFKNNGVDIILVYLATYSQDNLVIDLVYPSDCEIILWAEEEPLNYPVPTIAAYCGLTQIAGLMTKLGKKYIMMDGKISHENNIKKFKDFINVLNIKKNLIYANIGLIGSRSDGMLENVFNELELRKQVGPEVINISLVTFFNRLKNIKTEETENTADVFFKNIKDIGQETLSESAAIYFTLKEIVSDYRLAGLAVKCWPEFKENNICSPCFAFSRLYDEDGIPSACEADVTALVTMLIGDELSGFPSFLSDLLKIDDEKNLIYYYHCGCASTKLCGSSTVVQYSKHPFTEIWKPGVIVEFPVKTGPVTFARLGERNGKFQIVAYSGTSVETNLFVAGNVLLAKTDKKPSYIVEKLAEYGTEHHQISFYGNHLSKLRMLSDFLGINYFEI